jgi:hypothetical protein
MKFINFGDVFKNGCDFIFAVSPAALTGYLVVSGFLWDKPTVLGAGKKKPCTRICVHRVMCVF